jgi:hypothetical protein
MTFSKRLTEYVIRERERYALLGFFTGGLSASIIWLIAVLF